MTQGYRFLSRDQVDYISSVAQLVIILLTPARNETQSWPLQNLNFKCKNGQNAAEHFVWHAHNSVSKWSDLGWIWNWTWSTLYLNLMFGAHQNWICLLELQQHHLLMFTCLSVLQSLHLQTNGINPIMKSPFYMLRTKV